MPWHDRFSDRGLEPSTEFFSSKMYGRLSDLTTSYSQETNHGELTSLSLAIAQEATEERTDAYALIFALSLLSSDPNKREGVIGIRKITQYFEDNQLIFKCLVPVYESGQHFGKLDKELEQLERNYPRYIQNQRVDDKTNLVAGYLHKQTIAYKGAYNRLTRSASALLPHVFTIDPVVGKGVLGSHLEEPYKEIIASTIPDIKDKTDPREALIGYAVSCMGTIEAFARTSKFCIDRNLLEIFDPYLRKFGGVSLNQLVGEQFDSSDVNQTIRFSRMVNKYLANLPKGDYVYSRATDAIFTFSLSLLANTELQGGIGIQEVPNYDWYLKLSVWQQQLADQILARRIAKYTNLDLPSWFEQEKVDKTLQQLLTSNDARTAMFLATAINRGVTIRTIFDPMSFSRMSRQSALYTLAQKSVGLMDEDEMITETAVKIWPRLGPNIKNYLYELGDREGIVAMFLDTLPLTEKSAEITSQVFVDWATSQFGTEFINKLEGKDKEIQSTISFILNGSHRLPGSRWGEEIVNVEVEMSEDSMARKVGIRGSLWEFPQDQNQDINFVLMTNNTDLALSGYLNLDTRKLEFRYLDLPDNFSQLGDAMKLVAAATLHDILGRNIKEWKVKDEKAQREFSGQAHRSKKWLPRSWFRVNNETLIEQFDASQRRIKGETVGSKPAAYVPAHVRRVPYGAVIEAMIAKHNDSEITQDERERLLKSIRGLRDGNEPKGRRLASPDKDKIMNLPPAFQREVSPFVDPDGKLLYTRTFVAPHFNPKLKSIDYDTFLKLYEASYLARGSSLAFLELAIAELSGIESETEDKNNQI